MAHFSSSRKLKLMPWSGLCAGNDYEIYEDPRTIGHAVTCPEDTMAELKKLFNL